jgi:hypothetical protein
MTNQLELPIKTVSPIPNGIFTIVSAKTDNHRTFKISTNRFGQCKGRRFVSILVGRDNTRTYLGFANIMNDKIVVWKNKQTPNGKGFYEICAKMLRSLFIEGEKSPYQKQIKSMEGAKRCIRCNRLLTDPESIEAGMGPECRGKGIL